MRLVYCCYEEASTEVYDITPVPKPLAVPTGVSTSPSAAVELVYEASDGETKSVRSVERPLGATYSDTVPLTILEVHPRSRAFSLGLQKGWILRAIDGVSLEGKDSNEVRALLFRKTSVLPVV
uniref:PDZ domain-containing protein n=1 Tax=Noctiluca scintillans TaxID=2966 RepID=A0A7S1ALP6_NOCSC|mmetsp:Transcript_51508/g.137461  ORF Transcript_51508/g.137461 Transcript_51508/m.137461 type:complete len:123 (+) Transcript_51508:72-440(+)